MPVNDIRIGDMVEPIDPCNALTSGCVMYPYAIVCSLEPFIMISEETDMLWGREKIEDFWHIGQATPEKLQECIDKRMKG